ncbi:putative chromosome segregation protein Cse1 [Eremomyces bilateralis CBS 781.70]|uniref:Chromosome segregation protein Cse1 n=1 Tax=Eremomyces bilateralis CBS 781.70 TaxID=1392243 RepID=A0A6G1FWP4_9PEZI|nr:putative chromosome segregation protein Cse1 [Eremomyces bilateralis CBS 781.70]KAF1810049.1 putative chromosome segregation protein Cse1 [Eremomyces bilateralis CBS 781.70]
MATDLQSIAALLDASLDPKQNKQAELAIRQNEAAPGFSLALLHIVASNSFPLNTRLASSLYFKNFIRRNWRTLEGEYKLPQSEVESIKHEIIGLMISSPPSIQSQLGEAVSVIAESDFPEQWDSLIDDLASRLTADNPTVNNGVLRVAHSICERWRPLTQSDELYLEILHVISKFGNAFLTLLQSTDQAITSNASNKEPLEQWVTTLYLLMQLFYDLTCHDLAPVFEDNFKGLQGLFNKYLLYSNPLLETDDDSEAGVLENTKSAIFEILSLFGLKYSDVFDDVTRDFIQSSWTLLTGIGMETKYDVLVSKALHFLTTVCMKEKHAAESFSDENVLTQVVEKIIVSNLTLRESDIEQFEDEPIEYIRRDLEGSDAETRRGAATDFLRGLMSHLEKPATAIALKLIEEHLGLFAQDKVKNWKSKDLAGYLFTAVGAKGKATATAGVVTTNPHLNISNFLTTNILPDLTSTNIHPILQVDAIKFVYVFRSQLTQENWGTAFPLLVQHLQSSNYCIYTSASIALERALALQVNGQPLISKDAVINLSKDLLEHLLNLIQQDPAPEKIQENEFLMKCVMRVLIVVQDGITPLVDYLLSSWVKITMAIMKNPSNPRFYYYHFEAAGALIRFVAPSQSAKFEDTLSQPFVMVLQEDVVEFMPYVFQLLAALLEANPSGSLSELHKSLIQPILLPNLWETKGNVPALVRLLAAILVRGANIIVANNQVEAVLGIFQKLISTKTHENSGFDLLQSVFLSVPAEHLQKYFVPMVQLILTRLSNQANDKLKSDNLPIRFTKFYHFFSARPEKGLGTDVFIKITDDIQHDVFKQLYTTFILPSTQKLTRPLDRKTAVVSLTKTLATSQAFATRFPKGWAHTAKALLDQLYNPPVIKHDEFVDAGDVEDLAFGVGFTALGTCRKAVDDPFAEIAEVKTWVGQYLIQANAESGGKVVGFVNERLDGQAQAAMQAYLSG